MKARTIDVGGNRVLRVGTYSIAHGDAAEPPEERVFIAAGWRSVPLLPFTDQTVDVPASALPALLAVMEDLT